MGLTFTYETLTQSILQYTLEGNSIVNTDFAAFLPTIINIAEERIIRDLNSNIFDTEIQGTLLAGDPYLAIPVNFLGIRSLRVATDSISFLPLKRVDITWLDNYWRNPVSIATPLYYSVYGNNESITSGTYKFAPTPDLDYPYILRYIARPETISPDNDTTWLSTHAADCLLYACLAESMAYLREDIPAEQGMTQMFEQKYARELVKLKEELSDQIITGLYY
jgi:hypothetical protein